MAEDSLIEPGSFAARAVIEARRLLRMSEERRGALFAALRDSAIPVETLDRKQTEALAERIGVSETEVRATFLLSHFLKQHAEKDPDLLERVKQRVHSSLSPKESDSNIEALLEQLAVTAGALDQRMLKVARVAGAMVTYEGCSVASDVRLIEDETKKSKELLPVAIVRIALDEADDAIFQCTPEQLIHFIERLKEAKDNLELLVEKVKGINFSA